MIKKMIRTVLLAGVLGVYLFRKRDAVLGIAATMAYAAAFSLLLAPLCKRMELRGIRPSWAAAGAVIGLFVFIFAMIAALVPYMIGQVIYLFRRISPAAVEVMQEMALWTERTGFVKNIFQDTGNILGKILGGTTGILAKAGMNAAAQLGRIAFALILTYYVLCDRKRIANHLLLLVPVEWRNPALMGLRACGNAILSYFSAMLKTSLFVSATTCAGLLLLGIQDAVLLSVFMGLFEVFPYIGPVVASIPILLSAMMVGTRTAVMVLVLLVLIQQLEGNLVSPYFTASSTSVHPLAAMVGVFVFGSLIGFWGLALAVPFMVLLRSMSWSWHQIRHMREEALI